MKKKKTASTYEVYPCVLGRYPKLDIDEETYLELAKSMEVLHIAYEFEQRFELVLQSYKEWELEIAKTAVDVMLNQHSNHSDFHFIFMRCALKIGAFLSFVRFYVEKLESLLRKLETQGVGTNIKDMFSEAYDSSFNYRFMEAIRNYAQHKRPPVHRITLPSKWNKYDKGHEDDDTMESSVSVLVEKSRLEEDGKFKKTVLNEMEENVDLVSSTRAYLELVGNITEDIRKQIKPLVDRSRQLVENIRDQYAILDESVYKDTLNAGILSGGRYTDEVSLQLQTDDTRILLRDKNTSFQNLSKRHISTRVVVGKEKRRR